MLMSSTVESLKSVLGNQYFAEGSTIFTSEISELSYANFSESCSGKDRRQQNANAAMTKDEIALKEEHKASIVDSSTGMQSGTHSVKMPVSEAAQEALKKLLTKEAEFLSLKIENEKIELDECLEKCSVEEIVAHIPEKDARFLFFVFNHEFEGEQQNPIFFIYRFFCFDLFFFWYFFW